MTDRNPKRPRDTNQLAKRIVDIATGDEEEPREDPSSPAARGREGGLKGGKARKERLSEEERKAIARKAAAARWGS